jgi:glutamine amidotransferase PdxT
MAAAFHPELTEDSTVHRHFLDLANEAAAKEPVTAQR